MCSIDDIEQYDSALARCEETAGNHGHTLGGTWYPVDKRLRASMCEVRGDGVGNSAGPGEALANRRYGARGGVSAVERALGRSRRKRRLRPFLDSAISKSWFQRMGFGGSLLSETQSSQILVNGSILHCY